MELRDIISSAAGGGTAVLPSGEFEGPVVIDRPLRLVGKNTTIYAKNGAAVYVKAPNVTLEGLRVEITEGDVSDVAIEAECPAAVSEVEVLGRVRGFGSEDGNFDVPRTIALGNICADEENTFRLTVNVPEKTTIECSLNEVRFSPNVLSAGRNEITLSVSGISARTLLYAEALFKSKFIRRVSVTGRPAADKPVRDKEIYTAPSAESLTDVISMTAPKAENSAKLTMTRGMRTSAAPYVGTEFSVWFECRKNRKMDIDPYVFMLDKDGRAVNEKGFVFFGNERSEDGAVRYFPQDGHIEINLAAADCRVEKITLAYAVYAEPQSASGSENCFAYVERPRVSLCTDTERVSFEMDGLSSETAAVAMEFYLYKGEWRISAVGAGYNNGIARLCRSFGLEVTE